MMHTRGKLLRSMESDVQMFDLRIRFQNIDEVDVWLQITRLVVTILA
jgi:hypothetical protein